MPRKAKPFFRAATGWWMLWTRDAQGRRVQKKLVEGYENQEAAELKWHEFMSKKPSKRAAHKAAPDTVWSLFDRFLVHASENLAATTVAWYEGFINDFASTISGDMLADELRVHHVQTWLDEHREWSASTKSGAVCSIRRAVRWATEQGILERYPLFGLKGPQKEVREVTLTDEEFQTLLAATNDETFKDLLRFLRETGARPQEACNAEIKHLQLASQRIVFPRSQAKGKKAPRAIYLNDVALEIVKRRKGPRKDGHLFLNRLKEPWSSNAIRQRFKRIGEKIGVRYCAYQLRHTFATGALEKGLDPITVSTLMGHADASTLARTYQHLAKNPKHLIEAAKRAR